MGCPALRRSHMAQFAGIVPVANRDRREPHQRAVAGGARVSGTRERISGAAPSR